MAGLGGIGLTTGQDWQDFSGGLSDALGIQAKKDKIKSQLTSGFLQATGVSNFLDSLGGNPPPTQPTQPQVPPTQQSDQPTPAVPPSVAPAPASAPNEVDNFLNSTIPGIQTSMADFGTIGNGLSEGLPLIA